MRYAVRSIVVLMTALLGAVAISISCTITAAITLAATALVVPGTGTPNANVVPGYMENFRDYYMQDTDCTTAANCDLEGINYPASFWPLSIFPGWCETGRCEKWNVSVGQGVSGLNSTLIDKWAANPDEDIVIVGYSQGGAVVSNELRNLADLSPELKQQLEVVMIGNISNPDGGLWQRLSFLGTVPILDATFGPPMITDSGIAVTNIGFEYDPVVYAPLYWSNPLAMLNALAAFDTVHGQYLAGPNRPGTGTLPYGYTEAELAEQMDPTLHPENFRYGGNDPNSDNVYIMIPAKSLPLADLILSLGAATGTSFVVKPLVDLFAPMAKVLIDLGYDWSGDPNVPRTLSILPFNPFNNWVEVGGDLIRAADEGIQAFLGNFGASTSARPGLTPPALKTPALAPAPDPEPVDPAAETSQPDLAATPDVAETEPVTEPDQRSLVSTLRSVRDGDTLTAPNRRVVTPDSVATELKAGPQRIRTELKTALEKTIKPGLDRHAATEPDKAANAQLKAKVKAALKPAAKNAAKPAASDNKDDNKSAA